MDNKLKSIVLYGALWGAAEATLGYVLHALFIPITGFIMFPIGFYFMKKCEKSTQSTQSILYVAAIASAIKLVGLLVPGAIPLKVVNPAFCILAEGVLVMIFANAQVKSMVRSALIISFGWRLLFVALIWVQGLFGPQSGLLRGGFSALGEFIVVNGGLNALLIFAIAEFVNLEKFKISPRYSYGVLGIALVLQFVV